MANQAVYGIAKDKHHADRVVQALIDAGIPHSDISFLANDQEQGFQRTQAGTRTTGTEANRNWRTEERLTDYPAGTRPDEGLSTTDTSQWKTTNDTSRTQNSKGNWKNQESGLGHEKHTKAPEGATTGAATGGIIGGALGLLAGVGALAIPGLGPFIAAGPIMATLAGIGSGGTIGGIIGALVGSGIPEYEAKRYSNRLQEGGVLISVRANSDSTAKRVKEILQNNQVEDVSISSEASTSKNYKK